jgi:hypothetical protein
MAHFPHVRVRVRKTGDDRAPLQVKRLCVWADFGQESFRIAYTGNSPILKSDRCGMDILIHGEDIGIEEKQVGGHC